MYDIYIYIHTYYTYIHANIIGGLFGMLGGGGGAAREEFGQESWLYY